MNNDMNPLFYIVNLNPISVYLETNGGTKDKIVIDEKSRKGDFR